MNTVTRENAEATYRWDFTDLFESKEAWEKVLADCEEKTKTFPSLLPTLFTTVEATADAFSLIFDTEEKLERAYIYAQLHKDTDNGNAEYQEMQGRAFNVIIAMETALAPLGPTVLSLDEAKVRAMLNTPELSTYRFMIEDILRSKPHMLDAAGETLLSRLSDVSSSMKNPFTMLESVDMSFPTMKDENGNEVSITHALFGVLRDSSDRRVREESFTKYFGEFKRYINTFAAIYANSIKMDCFLAGVRNYESSCHAALDGGNVPVSVYDSLVSAIHEGLPTMRRYLDLRRRVLGLDELHMYDLYCPMVESVDYTVTFEESRDILKKALAPLGERYGKLLDEAYDNRWMDVYEGKGKTTGAFSCGVYGSHPYVLLNYQNSLDNLFTTAHELGHAMHSYFSCEAQDYVNHGYRIMVAEVASTVNEVLLTRYLLNTETSPARRAYILNHFLEGFRTTVFRQTLFAEFERKAHDMHVGGTPLTAKTLSDLYRSLNELYYEGAVTDELQAIEWARIPHFYRAYYVYQYATGFCSAVAIADAIYKTGSAESYLEFLKTGGSDYPMEELKIAGVDLSKPETVKRALGVFDETLTELEALFASGNVK